MEYKRLYFESLGSTNDKAKELASSEREGLVIIADEQTGGKGRMGRTWASARGKDILLSIILKPKLNLVDTGKISLIAAAAVNTALKDIGIESRIKWPNDIIIDGKKICGILSEASFNDRGLKYIVLGIGINVNQDEDDIDDDLKEKSTSLRIVTNKEQNREVIIDKLLNRFREYYLNYIDNLDIGEVIDICKSNSAMLGREVMVLRGKDNPRKGLARDINMNGELVVEFPEGIESISSGEVSVRGIDAYI